MELQKTLTKTLLPANATEQEMEQKGQKTIRLEMRRIIDLVVEDYSKGESEEVRSIMIQIGNLFYRLLETKIKSQFNNAETAPLLRLLGLLKKTE